MKIVLIGATGTVGSAVTKELSEFDVVKVGFSGGDYQVDIEDRAALDALFEQIGMVDAIISTTGQIAFGPIKELNYEQFATTVNSKILGHINLFQAGREYVKKGGSMTFTSGYLAQHPIEGSSAVSLVNAALDSFAKAAALELADELRVNTVSPRFLKETLEQMGMETAEGVSAADTAKAYRHAILATETGQAFDTAAFVTAD
jgi:NAD(P)-dependent dehydrogenase (short-subunit alcohol dehydrogenase family)